MRRFLPLMLYGAILFEAHAAERGLPFMSFYPNQETEGHVQNWDIIQDNRGIMYIGNGHGVQEFDGATWRLITSPNKSLARSFAMDENGRIYVGFSGEFGYLEPNEQGATQFRSLMEYIVPEERFFNYINNIHVTAEGVYFQASEGIFRFTPISEDSPDQGKENWQVKSWKPQNRFLRAFYFNQKYYVVEYGIGLTAMENDSLIPVLGGDFFKNDRVEVMLPYGKSPDHYLMGTDSRGFFIWDGQQVYPFFVESRHLIQSFPYDGVVLSDGSFAVGTITGGFYIFDDQGKIKLHLDQSTGLSANTVGTVYTDRQNNIWLGVDG
ncbi:MAG: hypothetical protein EHM72_06360, partial [Calditrichaeota bacterium]